MLVLARFGPRVLWAGTFVAGLVAAAMMSRLSQPSHAQETPAVPSPTTAPSTEP
jgi:hypothetical protein